MNALEKLDNFILDNIFEPFAHKFQIYFGKNNFFLTYLTLYFFFAYSLFSLVFEIIYLKHSIIESVIMFIATVAVNIFVFDAMNTVKNEEKKTDDEFGLKVANWRRLHFSTHRSILLIFLLLHFSFVVLTVISDNKIETVYYEVQIFIKLSIIVISIYFSACNSLPKGDSKVKQWIDGFKASFLKIHPVKT